MTESIAVIFGGPSDEHDISILTGLQSSRVLSNKYEKVSSDKIGQGGNENWWTCSKCL